MTLVLRSWQDFSILDTIFFNSSFLSDVPNTLWRSLDGLGVQFSQVFGISNQYLLFTTCLILQVVHRFVSDVSTPIVETQVWQARFSLDS